ncbi:DEAD box ATP-dependent RNA helicase family member protein [Theileria equi strain WA]|uniref:RNA helicase n=1 Tax=Theileria equi strain WA TaxID=1537102 RepID=L0AZT9_THEEQ|nr:DEAD box ATP-dependent RNA helicase family member protein [Theileria equi strain WA]AFZ81122.1 DEAD box ATP-dependent RNA helicase family member protein [Theileria equi strain WA]|eukprot:XP_004830788.1 DEAD box ATP-dependent RNA helicase family member protein [Theileria equi strain WA]
MSKLSNTNYEHSLQDIPNKGGISLSERKQRIISVEDLLPKNSSSSGPAKAVYISRAQRQKNLEEAAKREQLDSVRTEERLKRRKREFIQQSGRNREHKKHERRTEEEIEQSSSENYHKSRENRTNESSNNDLNVSNSDLAFLNMLKLPEKDARAKLVEKELEQIREYYLGLKREKKKVQKPSEKFKTIFNFEWDESEDTTRFDNNPIYQNRPEPQLLFGRGFRAGIDVREQRKRNSFYDELLKRRSSHPEWAETISKIQYSTKKSSELDTNIANTHWTQKKREDMTDRDWRIFREDFDIYIRGGRVPPPIRTWAESPLPWELLEAIKKAGYSKPTPIQMQAIPIALEMRDLIGIAVTGSGKTAAFVLPMLTYVKSLPPLNDETGQDGPYSLILAPSRELALQIFDETNKFAAFCKCKTVAVVGGRSAEVQAFELRRGAEVVIGTPGRVKDCLDRAYTVLSQCNYVILDEADRMIDMGFEEVVNDILDCIPTTNLKDDNEYTAIEQELSMKAGHRRYRITHMFSATMPPAVEKLTRKYLRAPAFISIGDVGGGKRSITQRLEFVSETKKKKALQDILETLEPPIIIFVNLKKVTDVIAKQLNKMNYRAVSLHGGKHQDSREDALEGFKAGDYDILVATDVAGRGLDVEGVKAVINYDMPKDIQSYTHRIGRTGRAGLKGLAISLVTEDDSGIFYDLKQLLISTDNVVPQELSQHPASKIKPAASQPGPNKTGT